MTAPTAPSQAEPPAPAEPPSGMKRVAHKVAGMGGVTTTLLAIVSALIIGALVIALSDVDALKSGDIGSILSTIGTAYWALLRGAFGSLRGISETLVATTPLLLAGLAVALTFRAGLFNIGATGQMLIGGMFAVFVGFTLDGPGIVQIPLAILAAIIGGALWGFIPGFLKARTGAHEVITTIMLNYVASFLVLYFLKTDIFQVAGRNDPISKPVSEHGRLPRLFGFLDRPDLRAHLGVLLAIAAFFFVWWLLTRSTTGFEMRALGANADAARYAGMRPAMLTILAMCMSGALAGLAGASEILGTEGRATQTFAGEIGFDAIAVALLGRSTPIGVALSALLFGALQAGGRQMQVATDVPIDLIVVLRALVVIFIAAPALIKVIWRVGGEAGGTTQSFRGWGS